MHLKVHIIVLFATVGTDKGQVCRLKYTNLNYHFLVLVTLRVLWSGNTMCVEVNSGRIAKQQQHSHVKKVVLTC